MILPQGQIKEWKDCLAKLLPHKTVLHQNRKEKEIVPNAWGMTIQYTRCIMIRTCEQLDFLYNLNLLQLES